MPRFGHDEVSDGVRSPRTTKRTRGGRHRGVSRRIVEEPGSVDQCVGIECLVVDEPARARLDELARIGRLMAGGMRLRDDDDREPEGSDLCQRR